MRTCVAFSGRAKSSVTRLNFGAPGVTSSVRRNARLVVGIVLGMFYSMFLITVVC
jgi:hypothetical protein